MALIPRRDEIILHIYRCANCNGQFRQQTGEIRVTCAVQHSPGSCCHYQEPEVNEDQLQAALKCLEAK